MWVRRNKTALTHVSSSFLSFCFFSDFPEHLLLKVTYHPYWKCAVHYSAEVIDGAPDWHEDLLHHVTPSLMSIVLRPGNHHVICQYKNPFIRR